MAPSTGGAFALNNLYRMLPGGAVRPSVTTLATDAAIPVQDGTVILAKATAGAYVLAAPPVTTDGIFIVITNATAAAHVVTATTLIADGVTGAPHTTITFAAFKGSSVTLCSCRGLWNLISSTAAPVT